MTYYFAGERRTTGEWSRRRTTNEGSFDDLKADLSSTVWSDVKGFGNDKSGCDEYVDRMNEGPEPEPEPEPEKRYRAICYENSTGNKARAIWETKSEAKDTRDRMEVEHADTCFDFGYEKEGSEKADWKEPPKPEYPKTISRGDYSFSAWNELQERWIKDFLGIDPSEDDVDTHLSELNKEDLLEWRNYWKELFNREGMGKAKEFVDDKYAEYMRKFPIEPEPEEPEPIFIIPTPVEPEPEKEKTWLDILYNLPKIIFALTNPIPFVLSGLIPDEWKLKIVDFVLPLNALSKLILHKSIYEGESGEMTEWDWIDLAMGCLIFAGGAGLLARLGTKLGITVAGKSVARGVAGAVAKGTPESLKLVKKGLVNPKVSKEVAEEFVKNPALTTKMATKSPGAMKGIFGTLLSQAKANPLLAAMVIMQIDILAWGFGLSPLHARGKVLDVIKQMRVDMIRLDGLIKTAKTESDWKEIKNLLDQIKNECVIARRESNSAPAELYKAFGFNLDDVIGMLDTIDISIRAYEEKYPQLKDEIEPVVIITKEIIASKLKEEFTITNFTIEDGDTIDWPDNPLIGHLMVFADTRILSTPTDTKIRFLGIDTHESGTVAGKKETDYLKSLIDGKTLTVKINKHFDPERVIGRYGRLLAGIFVDGEDVMIKMLAKFGKDILTATTYQKKYRWIDWDYYKRVSKGETTKAKIKIYSKPSYCNIFIDDKNTKKITIETFELEPGTYEFTLKKFGYDDLTETIKLKLGDEIEKRFELVKTGEEEEDEKDDKEKGKIKIYSKPSYCNISIDDKPTHKLTIETFELVPGEYKFTISKPGCIEQSETIELKAGDELEKRFELKKTDEDEEEEEEEEEREEREKFSIYIDSIPSNAKLFIDGRYTHHLTPSDEKELSDVVALFSPGTHEIKVTRKGLIAVTEINILPGKNEDIILELGKLEEEIEVPPEEEEPEEKEEEEIEEEKEGIPGLILNINTNPTNAKIYIDGIYTHHLTPSDEKELSDVAYLLRPGKHKFRFTRSGLGGEQIRDIPKTGTVNIFSNLVIMGLVSKEEEEKEETTDEKITRLRAEIEELQKELDLLSLM